MGTKWSHVYSIKYVPSLLLPSSHVRSPLKSSNWQIPSRGGSGAGVGVVPAPILILISEHALKFSLFFGGVPGATLPVT